MVRRIEAYNVGDEVVGANVEGRVRVRLFKRESKAPSKLAISQGVENNGYLLSSSTEEMSTSASRWGDEQAQL